MKKQEIIKLIKLILKDIRKNIISKEHRHDEIDIEGDLDDFIEAELIKLGN